MMHEIGHALSAGWIDDKEFVYIDHARECYSGESCVLRGADSTPENVNEGDSWSRMSRTGFSYALVRPKSNQPRFAFSIEEASTIDLENLPKVND